jgi:hypothetical protein
VSLKLRQSFEEPGKKAAESFGKAFDVQFSKSMPGAEKIERHFQRWRRPVRPHCRRWLRRRTLRGETCAQPPCWMRQHDSRGTSDVARPVWPVATHKGELTARHLVITFVPTTRVGK